MNRAFPDRSLLLPYEDCVRFVQIVLSTFPHGSLKPWAAKQEKPLNYTLLVTLKNGKLAKPTPMFIQRVLEALDFTTELVSLPLPDSQRITYFQFVDVATIEKIQQRLDEQQRSE